MLIPGIENNESHLYCDSIRLSNANRSYSSLCDHIFLPVMDGARTMAINHRQLMQDTAARLSDLIRKRREIDRQMRRAERILRWTTTKISRSNAVQSLDPFVAEKESVGLSDAIRRVLSTYPVPVSAVVIRDLLPTVGFKGDFRLYDSLLRSIWISLRCLVAHGEVIQRKISPRNTTYTWASSLSQTPDSESGSTSCLPSIKTST